MARVLLTVVVFFFFKQKTAYEMRISDWSSDVCSSDLKAPLAQEILAIFVLHGDDALARRLDAVHETHRRGIREILERRCGFVREAVGREFRVATFDFLEIIDAPEVPVHADGAELVGRHTERFGP